MRVTVFSESPADEAAVRILADAVLGRETTTPEPFHLRSRGWPSVRGILPAVIKHLHYQTDVAGLVVVVDSDESTVHTAAHEALPGGAADCRLCQLRGVVERTQNTLSEVPNRLELKVAVGVAVPAVEAWYAWGTIPHVNEAAWTRRLGGEQIPYDKRSLKQSVYGTIRPSITLETTHAVAAARRLAGDIPGLERDFPGGFGALARELRSWREG